MLIGKTDILIPREGVDMPRWAVIACDQHTSEKEYWETLANFVGDSPSTLRLMLPEVYLGEKDRTEEINAAMVSYLNSGIFREIKDSYIYVERTLKSGKIRHGLVGALNLDEYDYTYGSVSPIRATEATVEGRLPPRVKIRKSAALEMPHVMVFCEKFPEIEKGELLYDFDLNMGGGHIKGWRCNADVSGIDRLAIGDGNHSLATAKKCGDREALVELVDIFDESIVFHPIHRVIFDTDTSFLPEKIMHFDDVKQCEAFCRDYVEKHGGYIDYIHGDDTAVQMGMQDNCAAALLPAFKKENLFDDVFNSGPYEKKSFSMGLSEEKRYYLECRRINTV